MFGHHITGSLLRIGKKATARKIVHNLTDGRVADEILDHDFVVGLKGSGA
jgi:hypothetical protein